MKTQKEIQHAHDLLVALRIVYCWGYRKGRMDEFKEWGTRKGNDSRRAEARDWAAPSQVLADALEVCRAQWVHSINAKQCIRALHLVGRRCFNDDEILNRKEDTSKL